MTLVEEAQSAIGQAEETAAAITIEGLSKRLGLARCLLHDPRVLLLDEPASGLDPQSRVELRQILQELNKLGKTILVSSHVLPELAEMCTHIGIMRDGSLLAEGSLEEVLSF